MTKETITVQFPGKFGPNVNGVFYSIDQKSGIKPEAFEKGKTYSVLVRSSESGKKYITQIVGEDTGVSFAKSEPAPLKGPAVTLNVADQPGTTSVLPIVKPGDDKILHKMKEETKKKETDWDGIARGKVACALFGDALKSPGLAMYATSREEYLKIVTEVTEAGIAFVWKHQKGN